jgi:hypothetical protein
MSIYNDTQKKYVEAISHTALAKELGMSLSALEKHALESGWDIEHKLYWQNYAISILKQSASGENITAVKELLRALGISRPVGRPSKQEVQKHIAIEARIEDEYRKDLERLANPQNNYLSRQRKSSDLEALASLSN